jgi:hypothetical protein
MGTADYRQARKYWKNMNLRLKKDSSEESSELATNCCQLKMTAEDGKQRPTDATDAETLFAPGSIHEMRQSS